MEHSNYVNLYPLLSLWCIAEERFLATKCQYEMQSQCSFEWNPMQNPYSLNSIFHVRIVMLWHYHTAPPLPSLSLLFLPACLEYYGTKRIEFVPTHDISSQRGVVGVHFKLRTDCIWLLYLVRLHARIIESTQSTIINKIPETTAPPSIQSTEIMRCKWFRTAKSESPSYLIKIVRSTSITGTNFRSIVRCSGRNSCKNN